jgi:ATP-dependent DNA ligase
MAAMSMFRWRSMAGEVLAHAHNLGREGIALKWENSFYRNGRSRNWFKTKNPGFCQGVISMPATAR